MARNEGRAVGGYYKTPTHLLSMIADLFAVGGTGRLLLDPCAGDGEAVYALSKALGFNVAACELEGKRYAALEGRKRWNDVTARGDFLTMERPPGYYWTGAGLLYLNPPYDTDAEHGRFELRFLAHATPFLTRGGDGWLCFVVPYYALGACAELLGTEYQDHACYRFPAEDFAAYKQVVLVARRRETAMRDAAAVELVRAWAAGGEMCTLGEWAERRKVQMTSPPRETDWRCKGFTAADLAGLTDVWAGTRVRFPAQIGGRRYPIASAPRAAHIAAALAAGVFNGTLVRSSRPDLPDLLVKGVFKKGWRRDGERLDAKGDVKAIVERQCPTLSVTALDLSAGSFVSVDMKPDINPTPTVKALTIGDLLEYYGPDLMRGMLAACPVLYSRARDGEPPAVPGYVGRKLFKAQAGAVETVRRLHEQDPRSGVIVLGEIGVGKSNTALAAALACGKRSVLIMCPPHLLEGWHDQARLALPQAELHTLRTIPDVDRWAASKAPVRVAIMSREAAKLGHNWVTAGARCSRCGSAIGDIDAGKTRARCKVRPPSRDPGHGPAMELLMAFAPYAESKGLDVWARMPRIARYTVGKRADEWGGDVVDRLRGLLMAADPLRLKDEALRSAAWLCPAVGALAQQRGRGDAGTLMALSRDDLAAVVYNHTYRVTAPDYERTCRSKWEDLVVAVCQATWGNTMTPVCGEPLYQATAAGLPGEAMFPGRGEGKGPRRYPLARWICQTAPKAMDCLIIDEAHEETNADSAQTQAAHRLIRAGAFTMLLSGSLTNGYASSLFMTLFAVMPAFRAEYGKSGEGRFVDAYGYWKRVVPVGDERGDVVSYGAQSDRVERRANVVGESPGVLPVVLLHWLLPRAVTLQKADLELDLPPASEVPIPVTLDAESDLAKQYNVLRSKLMAEIRRTRFTPGLAGKLWGQMCQLPYFLDRAPLGPYTLAWPEGCEKAGQVIAEVPGIDPADRTPKELANVAKIRAELMLGRRTLMFARGHGLAERYAAILREVGVKAVVLDAARVPTGKRQAWIDKSVIKAGADVLITNARCVQTGLNNLVYFANTLWVENPDHDAQIFRQANGRTDRVGQTVPTQSFFPYYVGTAQEHGYKLLMHKVGVSQQVDGLDPEAALVAAGVGDADEISGFSVGRQLFMMETGR